MTSEDSTRKNIWAATELGLYKIDNSSGNILHHYTVADGMANDYVYAAIPDNSGWAWCSTNRGIIAVNGETNEVMNFDLNQNLQSLEFNNRVFEKDNEGYIYF